MKGKKITKGNSNGYRPEPVGLDDVALPEALLQLTETISRNTHETWAQKRMEEGWRYGPERNDAKKLHPNLVPYSMLSEADRDYDRATALNAIRLIIKLGYTVTPPAEEPGASS